MTPMFRAARLVFRAGSVAAATVALAGCMQSCPAGLARMQSVQLFFGGSLAEPAWSEFAAATLTPAYPDGFTTYDAAGQWRDPATGRLVREHTRVVQAFGAGALARSANVVAAYRKRFSQQSVGVVEGQSCAGF